MSFDFLLGFPQPPGLGHTCLHLFWLQAQAEACETGAALQRGGAGWKFIYKNYSIQLHLMFCCHCCLVFGRSLNLHESTKWFNINGEQTSPNTNSDFLVSKIRGSHQHLQLLQWSIICNSGPGEILSRSKSMIWWMPCRFQNFDVCQAENMMGLFRFSSTCKSYLPVSQVSSRLRVSLFRNLALRMEKTQWPSTHLFSRNYNKIIMYWVMLDPFIAWKSIQIDLFQEPNSSHGLNGMSCTSAPLLKNSFTELPEISQILALGARSNHRSKIMRL